MNMKKVPLFLTLLALLSVLWGGCYLFFPTENDQKEYHHIIQKRKEIINRVPIKSQVVHQFRQGVQKDIWFPDHLQRLHLRIYSDHSHLHISHRASKIELIEELQDLHCWFQDQIKMDPSDPNKQFQHIRYFTALAGTYTFPSHKFYADRIDLYFFQMEGNDLPSSFVLEEAYLKGVANEVTFFLENQTPSMRASYFKSHFNLPKGVYEVPFIR